MARRDGTARENSCLGAGLMKVGTLLALLLIVRGALLVMLMPMLAGVLGLLAKVRFALTTLGNQGTLGAPALGVLSAWSVRPCCC